jgi:hypothetical protein
VESSLTLGCDRWSKLLDAAVLEPLRQEIKTSKGEIEKIDEELKTEGLPYQRRNELGESKHELKVKIKSIKADHDEKSDRAKKVRSQIEKWTCPEAETWEAWLSAQPLFDAVASLDGQRPPPKSIADFMTQESRYAPDINDGVRVNIAPIQKAGLLHTDVLDAKDADKAIADRAEWRADERRWVREGKLPQPGWWAISSEVKPLALPNFNRVILPPAKYAIAVLIALLKESGGRCETMRLAGAYGLLAETDLMITNAPSQIQKMVKKWSNESRQQKVEIGLFRAALEDLRSRDVLIPEERGGRTCERLAPLMLTQRIEDWVAVDAVLALRTIDSLDAARQEPILEEYTPEERNRWVA